MNDFFTTLPTTLQHLENLKATLDKSLVKLHDLQEVVDRPIPVLQTWTVPLNLMGWHDELAG